MKEALRIGFIGGSLKSAIGNVHRISCQMDAKFTLVSGCFSRTPTIGELTGREWGIARERVYSNIDEFVAAEANHLDAVAVLTPPQFHAEIIVQLIRNGIAVISEKPLTSSVAEALLIKSVLDSSEKRLFVTFNYTGYPMVRELRARIQRGDLGRLTHIRITMQQESYVRQDSTGIVVPPQKWRLQDGLIPTVSLDLGMHVIQLQRFLYDDSATVVHSRASSFGAFPEVIDDVDIHYKLQSGVEVHGWWGKSSLGYANGLSVEVFGSEASGRWVQTEPEYLQLRTSTGETLVLHRGSSCCVEGSRLRYQRFKAGHPSGFIEAFANLYRDFAGELLPELPEDHYHPSRELNFQQSLEILTLLELASESAASGRDVDVRSVV